MILFSDKIVNGTPESGVYGRCVTGKIVNGTPESGVYGRCVTGKIVNGTPESEVYGRLINKEDIQIINFTLRYDTESVHVEEKKMKINNQEELRVLNTLENAQAFCVSIIVDCLRDRKIYKQNLPCA